MITYNTGTIPPDSFFSAPVYLDDGFVLASPEMPFTADLIRALQDWGFPQVLSEGQPEEKYAGDETGDEAGETAPAEDPDLDRKRQAEEFCRNLAIYVERLFMRAAIGLNLDQGEIAEQVKSVCDMVREDRRFILGVQYDDDDAEGHAFLAGHTVKSTIIALIIGIYLKLPYHRLIELGIAAMVHEIGMVKVPQRIYSAQRALAPEERMILLTHPVAGAAILKANKFPVSISTAALQHHERENGSGYPQMLSAEKISLDAKIIAVACSYEALTADRPHRDAKDGHVGILDLLKNEGKAYDDQIIRALVYSLSLYPIGLYVLLSSDRKGQVVDVNPENPRFPLVRIFGESQSRATSPEGLRIIRPLSREETAELADTTP